MALTKASRRVLHDSVVTYTKFSDGGVVESRNDLFVDNNFNTFQWQGDLGKVVPPESSPTTTGGYGRNAWRNVGSYYNLKGVAVEDFGAVSGQDCTQAFKLAVEEARKLNTFITAGVGDFYISERIFFGALTESDIKTADGYPRNVCFGLVGASIDATRIYPTASLKGDVVLDYTGLRDKYAKHFSIITTNPETAPAIGILTARFDIPSTGGLTNNDWGGFEFISLYKQFSIAAMVQVSTEETSNYACRFRSDHPDCIGAVLLTTNIDYSLQDKVKEAKETSLKFKRGTQSNLHQRLTNCDFYYGAPLTATREDVGMLVIHGCNQVIVESPFFNNNQRNVDCVRVVGGVENSLTNNIHVYNANCHKTTKSGIHLVGANTGCSWVNNATTVGTNFEDAEIVIDGYTSFFYTNKAKTLDIRSELVDSELIGLSDVKWDTTKFIQRTRLKVANKFETTGQSTTQNSILLTYKEEDKHINGRFELMEGYMDAVSAAGKVNRYSVTTANTSVDVVETKNVTQSQPIRKTIAPQSSSQPYAYHQYIRGDNVEVSFSRGGFIESHLHNGGLVLKSPNGSRYAVRIGDDGGLTTTKL